MLFGAWSAYCDEHYPLIGIRMISEAIRVYQDYPDYQTRNCNSEFENYRISNNLLIFQLSSSLRAELALPIIQIAVKHHSLFRVEFAAIHLKQPVEIPVRLNRVIGD